MKNNEIRLYTRLADMVGIGEEWLVDAQGCPILKFVDGNVPKAYRVNENETGTV